MESRLKERLTGAAILVALIVLVVPELFRGQPSDVATFAGSSSSGEGPPVRSYTIDLSNSPARASPLQSSPDAGGGNDKAAMVVPVEPVNAPGAGNANPAAAAAPAPPTPVVAAPVVPAPAAAAAVPPPAAPPERAAAPVTTAPSGAAAAAGARAAAASKPTTVSSSVSSSARTHPETAHSSAESGWIVQLGLFARRDNAERLADKAQAHGFSVNISANDAKGLYRVYAGGMANRAAAEAYTQRLKDQGFAAAIVAAP